MENLLSRHSGHSEELSTSYHKRNDDIVKYGFWAIVVLVISLIALSRVLSTCIRILSRSMNIRSKEYSLLPEQGQLSAGKNSVTYMAYFRRITYPRFSFDQGWLRYLDPPSQGEVLFLLAYWGLLSAGLWVNVIFKSPIKIYGIQWEVVGFRAAWVGTTQFPLLYTSGCKHNVISLLTGSSVQRLNWFHRWIACTMFVILGIHWTFFFQEWVLAGFVRQEINMMPMVIWGFAAWTAIGLMVISGFRWFRDKAFEVWLISHVVLAWSVLALSYTHTHCTTYFVVASLACLMYDLVARLSLFAVNNLTMFHIHRQTLRYGHQLRMNVLDDDYVRLNIKCPNFSWKAGQYIYLNVPSIQPLQSHPFTIVNTKFEEQEDGHMIVIVKKHTGFTKQLHRIASKAADVPVRCLLQGPHGIPPDTQQYDEIIFISMGNRASYCVSLLQEFVRRRQSPARIHFCMIVANINMYAWYKSILRSCSETCLATGSILDICVYVTRPSVNRGDLPQNEIAAIASDSFIIGKSSIDSDRTTDNSDGDERDNQRTSSMLEKRNSRSEAIRSWHEQRSLNESHIHEDQTGLLSHEQYSSQSDWGDPVHARECHILYGRPDAQALLSETIKRSEQKDRILVVAAVSSVLAASLSNQICECIGGARKANHSENIKLWIEQND